VDFLFSALLQTALGDDRTDSPLKLSAPDELLSHLLAPHGVGRRATGYAFGDQRSLGTYGRAKEEVSHARRVIVAFQKERLACQDDICRKDFESSIAIANDNLTAARERLEIAR
jgi:hypothetical protein